MRVLLIVPPEREDFYGYLSKDGESDYFLLWYEKRDLQHPDPLPFIKYEFYWEDYATPAFLLKAIKPDKIIFFEIIDQRQIALLVTAHAAKLTTIYLEHGAAADKDTALERSEANLNFYKIKVRYILKRLLFKSLSVLKTKFFYFGAFTSLHSLDSAWKYICLPFAMQWNKPNKALRKLAFAERVPRYAIVFNENNFAEYSLYTGAPPESAYYTGVPIFDQYNLVNPNTTGDGIVYIEHPYLESRLLNWGPEHHRKIAEQLFRFATQTRTKVLVKLHPRSDFRRWQTYALQSEYFEIVQKGDFIKDYLTANLILGYSSSLITGLICARKNIVLLGWHPSPRIFGTDFSKTGLCHTSMNHEELFTNTDRWTSTNLAAQHNDLYQAFLKKYNYPFDGHATDRVIHLIQTL